MESVVYNQEGKEVGKVKLPESVFGAAWNGDLVHQVVVSMQSNARRGTAHTKTRGEVAGGGKKPWRQKGTGRARHGSTRSPIWVGGGITHGPRSDKDYSRKINRKMSVRALYSILSKKNKDKEIVFVDKISLDEPKARLGKGLLSNFSKNAKLDALLEKKNNAALFVLSKRDKNTELGLRNFSNITVGDLSTLNPVSAMSAKYIFMTEPESAVSYLSGKMKAGKK